MMEGKRFFRQPEKNETLAQRQQEKIVKLNHLHQGLARFSPQWWVGKGEIVGLVVLFLLNLYLLLPFFGHQDQTNVFSAPVVPLLVDITSPFVSYSYGVRVILLTFLLFFPFSFYLLAKAVARRKLIAFLASFLVILPIGVFLPPRLNLGILAEDGAHIASLTLTPLVCLFLLEFLRQGRFWAGVFCALGTTAVALTSPFGLLVLVTFMTVISFSETLLGRGRIKAMRFLVVLVLAAGFSAFWYNPKFIILTLWSPQGALVGRAFSTLLPVSFFLLPLLGVFGFLIFENRAYLQPLFVAFFLTVCFGLFSLGTGLSHPSPSRFLPALGISLSLLLGILAVQIFDFLRFSPTLGKLKVSFHGRQLFAFSFLSLLFIIMVIIILIGRQPFPFGETQILGVNADKTVGIWEIKQQTSRLESLVGCLISAMAVLSTILLRLKLR